MDFRERTKRLAGYNKTQKATMPDYKHEAPVQRSEERREIKKNIIETPVPQQHQSKNPFNKEFFRKVTSDNILNEYIENNPKLRSMSNSILNESKKQTPQKQQPAQQQQQAPKENQKQSEFMRRVAEISRIASTRKGGQPTKADIKEIISEEITSQIGRVSGLGANNFMTEADLPPVNQTPPDTVPQPPPDMPAGNVEPDKANEQPTPPEPPKEEKKPEEEKTEEKSEEQKKVSKNQLVSNIVKSVNKLASYADWQENPEEKVKYLVGNMKRSFGGENPKKNPFSALVILLGALDKIQDETIKNVIVNNYNKHLAKDDKINDFIKGVWEGELSEPTEQVADMEKEATPEEPESSTPEPKKEEQPELPPPEQNEQPPAPPAPQEQSAQPMTPPNPSTAG